MFLILRLSLIAYNASVSFIDRKVTGIVVRAAGDDNKLLAGSIVEKNKDGEMIVDANINLKAYNAIINDKNGNRVFSLTVLLLLRIRQQIKPLLLQLWLVRHLRVQMNQQLLMLTAWLTLHWASLQ